MADDPDDNHYAGVSFGDFGTYMRHKKRKLQDQLDEIAAKAPKDLPQIFEGVIFYINGFTTPPIHEIRDMMVQRVSKSQITHIIAMNLTQAKMNEFKNYKVVRPEWVLDCIKAGTRLPWHRYSVLRVAGSLQQFGTRLIASPSKQAPSLIHDNSDTQSQTQPDTTLKSLHPNATDLVPSAPKDSPTLSTTPSRLPSNQPTNELSAEEDEIELMAEDEDMEWDNIDLDGLDEPLSLSPATPQRSSQSVPATSNIQRSHETSNQASEANEPTQPPQGILHSTSLSGTIGPGSNTGFKLVRMRRAKITPSPIGSLDGEPEESFFESSVLEDVERPADEGVTTAPENSEIDEAAMASTSAGAAGVDNRHPTLVELSNAWNRKNSSVEPGFVAKFFQSSRLHYLSTWKAKLREMMSGIQKKEQKITKAKLEQQSIMHIDFDCFFASVGTRDRPELAGKPVGVAHGSGGANSNSEIASCNYLAREYGVKNGMQLKKARSLCPDLVVVPYEFEKYEAISLDFYRILLKYADDLQAVSVDEALVDISSRVWPSWNDEYHRQGETSTASHSQSAAATRTSPEEFAQKLRDEIFAVTGCHASVGIGPNILLAKLSTKRAKPHGQYIWPSAPGSDRTILELQGDDGDSSQPEGEGLGMANASTYVISPPNLGSSTPKDPSTAESPLSSVAPETRPKVPRQGVKKSNSISLLPGVGYRTAQELEERFLVKTIFELQQIERAKLQEYCGMKTGDMLYKACRGIDDTQITADMDKKRQSVSAEISWGVRFENEAQLERFVKDLSVEVSQRLKDIGRKAKSLVMKIMKRKPYVQGAWKHLGHGPVDQYARTGQLPNYTDDPEIIAEEAMRLIHYFNFSPLDLRGIGIQMIKLDHGPQGSLASNSMLYDPVQQTTLAAMFSKQRVINEQQQQQKQQTQQQKHHDDLVAPNSKLESSATSLEQSKDHHGPQTSAIRQPTPPPPPLPEMEIDRATFEELPKDIQEDLLRHHQLKFLSQQADNPPNPSTPPRQLLNDNTTSAPSLAENVDQLNLPPWSQLNPHDLQAMSTPMIRKALEAYARDPQPHMHADSGESLAAIVDNGDDTPAPPSTPVRAGISNIAGDSVLPSPSKLDMSVLQALPADIRAEIEQEYNVMHENQRLIETLAHAGRSGSGGDPVTFDTRHDSASGHGDVRPNTGRNTVATAAGSTSSRRRGRPPGSKNKKQHHDEATATVVENNRGDALVQENPPSKDDSTLPPLPPPPDPEFLAALPPDLRAEIEENYRAEVLKHRQNLQNKGRAATGGNEVLQDTSNSTTAVPTSAFAKNLEAPRSNSHTAFPAVKNPDKNRSVDLRPTLDGEREIGPLRQMVSQWVQSTLVAMSLPSDEPPEPYLGEQQVNAETAAIPSSSSTISVQIDKGPTPEDVSDFIEFLVRVVAIERDLDRVRLIVRWLQRKVAESEFTLALSHRQANQWLRQWRLSDSGQENEEEQNNDGEEEDVSLNRDLLATWLNSCSQPAMTWRQALTRIEIAVQGVVHQMYGGTLDLNA
ncbi:deoxycytidyl transferase [Actinomortierella wolfii]|nr:deoxycytidyl transferase [Actinomortierella wolfii]